jgi:hypothetical protein
MQSQFGAPRKTLGGARLQVQQTAEALAVSESNKPTVAARIYSPPALKSYDESDPRYEGKSDAVENIYLPSQFTTNEARPRSGIQQIFNWLLKGKLE